MTDEIDGDLLKRFVNGDQEAFEKIFRRFEGEVYRWILRMIKDKDAAEDVLVEAFWRAYRWRARFDPARSFGAWMRRIAANAALDHLGKMRARAKSIPDEAGSASADPDRGLGESIALAFHRLPPKLGVVATLALVEEQPYAEIAEALNVPVGTVKSRLNRAIRKLKEELARMGIQP